MNMLRGAHVLNRVQEIEPTDRGRYRVGGGDSSLLDEASAVGASLGAPPTQNCPPPQAFFFWPFADKETVSRKLRFLYFPFPLT